MPLVVGTLELSGFRSYADFVLPLDPHLTVLVGPNATGKTNIIEALQLVTAGESFRRPQWLETVAWGTDEALVRMTAEGDGREVEIELRVGISGKRVYKVNGKVRRRVSEAVGLVPCVIFTPDDLRIVKDSAERRRTTLDSLGVQLSPSYRSLKIEYEKTLRQRNSLLKEKLIDDDVLRALTDRMIVVGSKFTVSRIRLFTRLSTKMSELYGTLSGGENLTSHYVPSWSQADSGLDEGDVETHLEQLAGTVSSDERARGTTLFGPHRDDMSFEIDQRDARVYSSQGQQRTVTLAWKLAEVGVVEDISGQPPLLLLDDVMSELDRDRRKRLTEFVGGRVQTVITTTNLGYFDQDLVGRASVVELQ